MAKSAWGVAVVALVCWVAFGFDSTPMQFTYALYASEGSLVQSLLAGQPIVWERVVAVYNSVYGKEMHYSAFVIYGLMYWGLSRRFDRKFNIKGSKNVAYSCTVMLLAVAAFEWYWIFSYATFQNQPWVITFVFPQLHVLLQNAMFAFAGVIGVIYMWADSYILDSHQNVVARRYHFNWNLIAAGLIVVSVVVALLWWFYPWHVDIITVPLDTGVVWTNSQYFPQTLYTIDMNPADSINAGMWFYVSNDMIHAWNTLVKIVWTFTFYYLGRLNRK